MGDTEDTSPAPAVSGTLAWVLARLWTPAGPFYAVCLLGALAGLPRYAEAQATALEQQRKAFLRAEHKLAKSSWKAFDAIAKDLKAYPLYPYLEQAALLKNIRRIPDATIGDFLDRHPQLPITFKLRRAWLRQLARQRKWQLFSTYYQSSDGPANACLYAQALFHTGRVEQAWRNVRRLWLTARSLPPSCDAPLLQWREAGQLSPDLAWQRSLLAAQAGNHQLVKYLRRFVKKSDGKLLSLWLQARLNPAVTGDLLSPRGSLNERGEILASTILERLASKNLDAAMRLWRQLDSRYSISAFQRNRVQQAIAIRLARKQRPEASQWLNSDLINDPSDHLYHWRLATALRLNEWQRILELYKTLPARLRQQDKWRYWWGRALTAQRDDAGIVILKSLSLDRGYYGFRAADFLAQPYQLGHRSLVVDETAIQKFSRYPAVQRSRELLALKRTVDARREWRHLLTTLPANQLAPAALLAHRWEWHNIVIATLAKSTERDDLDLRFPLLYKSEITRAARQSGLSPARIYSVIRQESAFLATVRSAAGAWGLMQLLPATARQVARTHRLPYTGIKSLLAPADNLLLGSLYLKNLQNRFNNHPLLASAAYNAGATRVRRWMPPSASVSSEVWIENIPFTETREYLQRILTYQVIYARRLEYKNINMSDWMPDVPVM